MIKYNNKVIGIESIRRRYGVLYTADLDALQQLLKYTSAMWLPSRPNGQPFPTLQPRTLPNGVSNGTYLKNVSDDVVLQASDISSVNDLNNVSRARIPNTRIADMLNIASSDLMATKMASSYGVPLNGSSSADVDKIDSIGKYYFIGGGTSLCFNLPLGTTVEQARALLAGTVIRYQLATPIDTLNTPFTNPLIDLKGVVGVNKADVNELSLLAWSQQGSGSAPVNKVSASFINNVLTVSTNAPNNEGIKLNLTLEPNTSYTLTFIATGDYRMSIHNKNSYDSTGFLTDLVNLNQAAGYGYWSNNNTIKFKTTNIVNLTFVFGTSFDPSNPITSTFTNIQLELGSVATAYAPYGKANVLLQNVAGTSADGYTPVVLKGIGDEIAYSNLVTNGDFSQGTAGWNVINSTQAIESGRLAVTATAQFGRSESLITGLSIGKRYSVTATIEGTTNNYAFIVGIGSTITALTANGTQRVSFIFTATATSHYVAVSDGRASGWTKYWADNVMVTPLTDNAGVTSLEAQMGRQLTAQECDYLFAFTATSASVRAGIKPFLKFDGVDSYGIANNPSLDIVGTGDFAIECVFKTPETLAAGYFLYSGAGTPTLSYGGFIYNDGRMEVNCQNTGTMLNNGVRFLHPNSLYSLLYYRKNGKLKARVNRLNMLDVTNANSLISQPYFRVCASTSNGTDVLNRQNMYIGHLSITNGAVTPFTEEGLIKAFDTFCAKEFGL